MGALLPTVCLALASVIVPACRTQGEARTLYVAGETGDDANSGMKGAPFQTWQRAIRKARPGDTILIAPGVYRVEGPRQSGVTVDRSGTASQPITLGGDGGKAILDCSGLSREAGVYCLRVEADWWRFSDVGVTGALQNSDGAWSSGFYIINSSDNVFERVSSFENQGPGIVITGDSRRNTIIDCELYSNYDPLADTPGGNADGIQFTQLPSAAVGNSVDGCRAAWNSDDGFDLWESEAAVVIRNSYAIQNGFVPGTAVPAGDGVGFKLGRNQTGPNHQILDNTAVENRGAGFDNNDASAPATLIGNEEYGNLADHQW